VSETRSPDAARSGAVAVVAIGAVLALVFSVCALVLASGDDGAAGGSEAESGPVHVSLTEFAIEPGAITVEEGGSLHVTNDGSTAHNLAVVDQDLATPDIAAGEAAQLDLGDLPVGSYDVVCLIPGHADSGMTGTLEVVAAGSGGGGATAESAAGGDPADEAHDGHELTEADYAEMSAAMDETIGQFPAETEGQGNEELEPTVLDDGTKHFDLTAAITPWEVAPGQVVDAWTYNGTVPGPQMHVDVGDTVEIEVHNELPMVTDLHLHGVNVPNSMDGVAPITQDGIQPGESFTYRFTTDEVAVAMFHAHHHAQLTVPNGLLGMFYVGEVPLPAGRTIGGQDVPADVRVDQEIPMVLNDAGVIGYALNGKSFPATAPVVGQRGDWLLIHYANEGTQIHPMHLHQFDQIVVAKDGYPLDEPYVVDTLNVAPGERYSVLVQLESPGTWVWHCHILPHVERETGMFGMVTAVVVEQRVE
jgi:FtsP/CotA-like multicopper oxidase with cupredoxin domain